MPIVCWQTVSRNVYAVKDIPEDRIASILMNVVAIHVPQELFVPIYQEPIPANVRAEVPVTHTLPVVRKMHQFQRVARRILVQLARHVSMTHIPVYESASVARATFETIKPRNAVT